jgi:hypothetical protein
VGEVSEPSGGGNPPDLPPIHPERLTGDEPFTDRGQPIGATILDYWRWSASELMGNTSRGAVAEFLVARAVGADVGARDPWSTWDIDDPRGIKIEVKSAAYIQSWRQRDYSRITFGCGPARAWEPEVGDFVGEACRHADVYVFALLVTMDQATIEPLDVAQWEFLVVPTWWLDNLTPSQHSIGLKALQESDFGTPVTWGDLARRIGEVAATRPSPQSSAQ